MTIEYAIASASEQDIYEHLEAGSGMFSPPLCERVNLKEYARKLAEKSVTFEAWAAGKVVGLVAAYFNDAANLVGFISHVCTLSSYADNGIASKLFTMCLKHAVESGYAEIRLEVHSENTAAIALYEKFGFKGYAAQNGQLQLKCILNDTAASPPDPPLHPAR